jgi:polyphosphate:AMP phosphotransferase
LANFQKGAETMLEKVNLKKIVTKEEYRQQTESLKKELSVLQQEMKQVKLPVIVVFEGWGTAGKGSAISKMILNLDPRGFKVYSITDPTTEEQRKPILWRYWNKIPAYGNFSIFDRSWYQDIFIGQLEKGVKKDEITRRTQSIRTFERQLHDDGYLIIKFFLHIDKKEQKKRLDKLKKDKNTAWRVTKIDRLRNEEYDRYYKVLDEMITHTDTSYAPWHLIGAHDTRSAMLDIYTVLVKSIKNAVARKKAKSEAPIAELPTITVPETFHLVQVPKLAEVSLDKSLTDEEYREELEEVQAKLHKLHNKLYQKKIPVIIGYEGWDAAGKGGNIKRVAAALDPRGYEVIPIAAPDKNELAHQYLWRFWNNIPKDGHIAIFDRTWYGRVMVERLEGFCSNEDWHRAYTEINEFEKELYDWGAILVKFWIHIDKDEQLKRFKDRENTPEKRWKITDEDWRNREKWDQYEVAVNDMLQYTSTDFAPWNIIESKDKKFARIKAIKILIHEIEQRL